MKIKYECSTRVDDMTGNPIATAFEELEQKVNEAMKEGWCSFLPVQVFSHNDWVFVMQTLVKDDDPIVSEIEGESVPHA